MIPCKNCIVLAICKGKISKGPNHYEDYIISITILMRDCSILNNYLRNKKDKNYYSIPRTHEVYQFLTGTTPNPKCL